MSSVDVPIVRPALVVAPKDYEVPAAQEIAPLAVRAFIDGTNAGGGFVPTLQLLAPGGEVMWTAPTSETVAAGASADVSWFPRVGGGGGGGGIAFDTFPQAGDWLYAETTSSDANTGGFGIELKTSDGIYLNNAGNSVFESNTGLTLRTSGGNVAVNAPGAGKSVHVLAGSRITLDTDHSFGYWNGGVLGVGVKIGSYDKAVQLQMGTGAKITFLDSSGSPLLEVRDDGTFHIKAGATWLSDL